MEAIPHISVLQPDLILGANPSGGKLATIAHVDWLIDRINALPSGGGTPGGNIYSVQFNNIGVFGGSDNFTWDGNNFFLQGDGTINDSVDTNSFVWGPGTRTLYDDSGRLAMSFDSNNGRVLHDENGNLIMDFNSWALRVSDDQGNLALNWANGFRYLCDENGSYIVDFSSNMKIGISSVQKIGFWGKTPVAQQVLATGAGHTADNIITALQNIGLFKQS